MKQWFPFTDYDFYAYLTAGMLVIGATDYSLGAEVLVRRTEWTTVQVAFWIAVAYMVGQVVAGPSSALIEHFLARRLLHPPIAVLLGMAPRRRRERIVAALFANREYAPLPDASRKQILSGAAAALHVTQPATVDAEDVFGVAFRIARRNADAASRMDQFRNTYGFARNASFSSVIAAVLLALRMAREADHGSTAILLAGSVVLVVGMFGRFIKFYAAYSNEVFSAYGAELREAAKASATTKA